MSKDRTKASLTVSPAGLTLMYVGYDDISSEVIENCLNNPLTLEQQLAKMNYLAIKEA